jgi:hypothetical protein
MFFAVRGPEGERSMSKHAALPHSDLLKKNQTIICVEGIIVTAN